MKAAAPPRMGLLLLGGELHELAGQFHHLGGEGGRHGGAVAEAFLGRGVDTVEPEGALVSALAGDGHDVVVR